MRKAHENPVLTYVCIWFFGVNELENFSMVRGDIKGKDDSHIKKNTHRGLLSMDSWTTAPYPVPFKGKSILSRSILFFG